MVAALLSLYVNEVQQSPEQTFSPANVMVTPILDWQSPGIRSLACQLQSSPASTRELVQTAHRRLTEAIQPVYDLNERQPASVTLEKGRGSCSQRMACLEALARAAGIATRVRALYVDGRFWFPRFPLVRVFIPKRVLLIWPQFLLEDHWVDFDELYASMSRLVVMSAGGFTNEGESLFEAVQHMPIDFFGKTCGLACAKSEHDLSSFVLANEGIFNTRDEVFDRFGSLQDTLRGRLFAVLLKGRSSSHR